MRNDIKRLVKISYNLENEFDDVTSFNNGLAVVTLNNYKGVINTKGEFILPIDFDNIEFDDEYICVNHYGIYEYYNKVGKKVIPNNYYFAMPFKNNIAKVQDTKDSEPYYIGRNGIKITRLTRDVLEKKYNEENKSLHKRCNLEIIEKDNLYGFAYKNKIVIPPIYKMVSNFSDGLAKVQNKNGCYGFIDIKGKIVIPLIYKDVKDYSDNLMAVKNDNSKWYFINLRGDRLKVDCAYLIEYKDYLKKYEELFPTSENIIVDYIGYYVYADYKKYFISNDTFNSYLNRENKKPFKRG